MNKILIWAFCHWAKNEGKNCGNALQIVLPLIYSRVIWFWWSLCYHSSQFVNHIFVLVLFYLASSFFFFKPWYMFISLENLLLFKCSCLELHFYLSTYVILSSPNLYIAKLQMYRCSLRVLLLIQLLYLMLHSSKAEFIIINGINHEDPK